MERKKVNSSMILEIGYDQEKELLEVEFNKGSVFQYSEVSEETYSELMVAESIGKFFHANIRTKHTYEKVENIVLCISCKEKEPRGYEDIGEGKYCQDCLDREINIWEEEAGGNKE